MSAAVRPIYFPSRAALDWVQQRAHGALETWAAHWLPVWMVHLSQMQGLKISAVSEPTERLRGGYQQLRSEAGCMWVRCVEGDRLSLGRAVLGAELMPHSSYADDWIVAAVARAWDARNHALCTALLGAVTSEHWPSDELPANLLDLGSGALQLSCAFLGLHAIIDSGVWRSVPSPIRAGAQSVPKPAPLEQAVRGVRVTLEALLGSVEIELAQLLDLTCGDVMRLPLQLGASIEVRCEGMHLVRAALGELHGHRSVRLLMSGIGAER